MLSHALQKNDTLDLGNRLLLLGSCYHLLKEGLKVELLGWSKQNDIGTDSSCRILNNIQMLKYWRKIFPFLTPTMYHLLKKYSEHGVHQGSSAKSEKIPSSNKEQWDSLPLIV